MLNRATKDTFLCFKIIFQVLKIKKKVYGNDRKILS